MSQFAPYIERLQRGETVQFRPHGNSMKPKIKSGQLVTVEPATLADVKARDVVLCKVNGGEYLHAVLALDAKQGALIGPLASSHTNGWTRAIFGKLVKVEP